jgi:CheY-like chemotaxis protein
MEYRTVLIIEDEQNSRECIAEILARAGFHTAEAANGAAAWNYLQRSQPPSLIILDINMPVMDGRKFREMQLRNPSFAEIPVIVVSALDSEATADLSANAVIRKPINIETLLQAVEANC